MQPHEKDLLMEAEGLKFLLELFQGIDGLLEKFGDEYGEYIDPTLFMATECMRYDLYTIMNGKIVFEKTTVPGIVDQLEDVLDEVRTLQAGLPCKKGVLDED